ncbi:MAG: phosphoribosylformylglycinamidine synthase, partial [Oscillospiraceae bacterium]
ERFDSSIGAGTVLSPFGGRHQETPAQAMAALLPVTQGATGTASIMAWGFDPAISSVDPYVGAVCAVCESIEKVIAAGGSRKRCWLSFQEYFERLRRDELRWGKPLSALLGALDAQLALGCAAIGGKDSMSGSFEQLDVPPTLISFAVSVAAASRVISPEFKKPGSLVALLVPAYDQNGMPELGSVRQIADDLEAQIAAQNVRSAWVCGAGGVAEGLFKMALGNRIGVRLNGTLTDDGLFERSSAAILVECDHLWDGALIIGQTDREFVIDQCGRCADLYSLFDAYANRLAPVFPYRLPTPRVTVPLYTDRGDFTRPSPAIRVARPRVLLPAFAGTNCEVDTARAFERAGAEAEIFV